MLKHIYFLRIYIQTFARQVLIINKLLFDGYLIGSTRRTIFDTIK